MFFTRIYGILAGSRQLDEFLVQEYSFTLTGGDGSRLHGFCRSFLPPRARLNSLRYPQVLCIITEHLWLTFYFKVLCLTHRVPSPSDRKSNTLLRRTSAKYRNHKGNCGPLEQVLQVLEALLKQTDLLNGPAHASLPYASPASQFLENLSITCTGKLCPGEVLRLPLPRTPTPVNVSPPRRIGPDFQSASQPPLRRCSCWQSSQPFTPFQTSCLIAQFAHALLGAYDEVRACTGSLGLGGST